MENIGDGNNTAQFNRDFDRVHELANEHRTLRQMIGHGFCDDDKEYSLQAIKDNVQLFTPEILDEINQVVVNAGVETHLHYPTDINLLFDAIKKRYPLQHAMEKD